MGATLWYFHPEHVFAKLWFMHQTNSNLLNSSLFSFLTSWIKWKLKQPTMHWWVTWGAWWIECCRRKCDKWVISTALNHSTLCSTCNLCFANISWESNFHCTTDPPALSFVSIPLSCFAFHAILNEGTQVLPTLWQVGDFHFNSPLNIALHIVFRIRAYIYTVSLNWVLSA